MKSAVVFQGGVAISIADEYAKRMRCEETHCVYSPWPAL